MAKKYKKYQKKAEYTYVFGMYSVLEVLENRPDVVLKIVTDDAPFENSGFQKVSRISQEKHIFLEKSPLFLRKISPQENHTIVAVIKKYTSLLSPQNNHIVLHQLQYSGNLGTILRTAHGFCFTDIAIIRPSVDHFDPKAIRASMGSLFSLNIQLFDSFMEYRQAFKTHTPYTFALDGVTLDTVTFKKPYILVFGSEGAGLDASVTENTQKVKIQHLNVIDSLNVTVAAGIAMYHAYSQTPS